MVLEVLWIEEEITLSIFIFQLKSEFLFNIDLTIQMDHMVK